MRRTWRQAILEDGTSKLVEVTEERNSPKKFSSHLIVGDLPDMTSPITGEVIHGRAGMRKHNKDNNVTHAQDFTEHWASERKRRDDFYTSDRLGATGRRKAIRQSIDKLYDGHY